MPVGNNGYFVPPPSPGQLYGTGIPVAGGAYAFDIGGGRTVVRGPGGRPLPGAPRAPQMPVRPANISKYARGTYRAYLNRQQAARGRPVPIRPHPVVQAVQHHLAGRGYAVPTHGIATPVTVAAARAHLNNVPPATFNQHVASIGGGGAAQPPTPQPSPANALSPLQPPAVDPNTNPSGAVDPSQYAAAATAAQFDPQQAELMAQMQQVIAQGSSDLQQMGGWYNNAVNQSQQGLAATQQSDQSLLSGQDQANQNLVQLFGGPGAQGSAAPEAAAFADINRAATTQLAQAQEGFQAQQPGMIRSMGADAAQQLIGSTRQQYQGDAQQLLSLLGQRGDAYTTNLYNAQQQEAQNQAAQQSMALAEQLAGPQVTKARADASLAQTNARLAVPKYNLSIAKLNATTANQQQQDAFRYAEVYGYNPRTGAPTLPARKAAAADARKGQPNSSQLKNWNNFAHDSYYGKPPKMAKNPNTGQYDIPIPGTGAPPVPYYSTLRRLMGQGATLRQAQNILDSYYKKGEAGRPYVNLQGRRALAQAGMPLPGTNNVPNQQQIAYLQAHGLWGD